ncbi:GTP-binding nuclear protein [Entamoeba marina]
MFKQQKDSPTFKLILAGDGGVGKTSFVKKYLSGEFEKRYIPTMGCEVHKITFQTNYGPIHFNVWDVAGQDKFAGLADGYYICGECGIIMFDLTSTKSYYDVENWYQKISRICKKVPFVLVGNKNDVVERKVELDQITFHEENNLKYCDISVKSNENLSEPFLILAKELTGNEDLVFMKDNELEKPVEIDLNSLNNVKSGTDDLSNPTGDDKD